MTDLSSFGDEMFILHNNNDSWWFASQPEEMILRSRGSVSSSSLEPCSGHWEHFILPAVTSVVG